MFDEISSSLPLKRYERYQFVKRPYWKIDNVKDMTEAIEDWTRPAMDFSFDIKNKFFSGNDGEIVKLGENEAKNFDEVLNE